MVRRTARLPVGYHDLLRDLGQPGCPACLAAHRVAWRYLDSLLWEYVNDPDIRGRTRASHGFCRDHALMAIDVANEQAGALGMALLYEDFLRHLRDEVIRAAGAIRPGRSRRGSALRIDLTHLRPHQACPACATGEQVARNYLRILATSTPDSEIGRAAWQLHRGVCLPHLVAGLGAARSREEADLLLDAYLRGEEELRGELKEYLRKQNWQHHDERPTPGEATAWRRAVYRVIGEPAPRKPPR